MKTRNINTYNPNIDFELSRLSNPVVRTHSIIWPHSIPESYWSRSNHMA